jgi:hypothetical protein
VLLLDPRLVDIGRHDPRHIIQIIIKLVQIF